MQARMQEMKANEVQAVADAERLEAERLAALQLAVEAASIDWEAEALLSFEKVPREQLHRMWSKPKRDLNIAETLKYLTEETCNLAYMLSYIRDGLTEEHIPKLYTLVNERARFRIRMLQRLFQSLQAEADAAAAAAAAEEACIAAEKAAVQAAAQAAAKEEHRMKMNGMAASSLADHPNFRTIQHNYIDYEAPETLFAAYKEYTPTGKRWLHVRRLTMGQMQEAHVRPHSCDFGSSHGSAPAIVVPESWADHYETGKTPFLTVCPVCKKAPKMHPTESNYMQYTGGQVECTEHYKWEPLTNTHYKWALIPPPPPPSASAHPAYGRLQPGAPLVATIPRPSGHWVLWDPKDPDGAKAAQAAKEKKIAETKAEIQRLMATLE